MRAVGKRSASHNRRTPIQDRAAQVSGECIQAVDGKLTTDALLGCQAFRRMSSPVGLGVYWRSFFASKEGGRFGKKTLNVRHFGLGARWANMRDLRVLRPVELVHDTVHDRREDESHCD